MPSAVDGVVILCIPEFPSTPKIQEPSMLRWFQISGRCTQFCTDTDLRRGAGLVFACDPVYHCLDTQDLTSKSPLNLCQSCNSAHLPDSSGSIRFDAHPCFNLQPQGSILARNMSTRSCPRSSGPPLELEEEYQSSDPGDRKVGGVKQVKKKPRRRHTDKDSSECFKVKFDLNVDIDTERVPAVKNKKLCEVLGPVFERKGIELSRVDLFLDQSNTPLSLSFEAYRFGGHYLEVRAKPGEEIKLEQQIKDLRSFSMSYLSPPGGQNPYILPLVSEKADQAPSGEEESMDLLGPSQRRRKNMTEFLGVANIPSPDTLAQLGGSLPSACTGPETWKNRFSVFFSSSTGPFGKEVDRVEQLQKKLHSYTLFGLPKVPPQLSYLKEETNLLLEDSWQQLLENPESLTRRQFHQQEAIWELLQTEASYIKKLRVITDLFVCSLLNLQENGLLREVELARLFGNIQEIVSLHTALWAEVMLPALEKARESSSLLDPTDLQQGFSTFASRFKPYVDYCMEEESFMEYLRNLLRDNDLFPIYVTWGEAHKQCNRLKLADMLAKPHQRLTKYPLLLKSVLKKTDEPAARDVVSAMVASVEAFINSVDSQMRRRQEQQKLAAMSGRIESYEAVEGASEEVEKILRDFNRFDITAPMKGTSPEETRQLLLEGALRMKEGKDSRMEVYCFLFTDMFLITKPVKRVEKVKVIRQPLLIHNVVCRELKDPGSFLLVYLNEFHSTVAAYSFQANSTTQGRSWTDAITKVQNRLQRLRSVEQNRQQMTTDQRPEQEEGEEEEESSNSTSSSPCLQHSDRQSDSMTETLSVGMIEEDGGAELSSSLETDTGESVSEDETPLPSLTSLHQIPDSIQCSRFREGALSQDSLDPQYLTMSVDSAYGTLSPESPLKALEMKEGPGRVEGEEVEQEGHRRGSQLLQSRSFKQPWQHSLEDATLKSHSEDNLLQCRHQGSEVGIGRRLSQLPKQASHSAEDIPQVNAEDLTQSLPSRTLAEALRGAKVRKIQRGVCSGKCLACRGKRASLAPLQPAGRSPEGASSSRELGTDRKSPCACETPAEHQKKLTLAQMYKIRTTLVLNSTLTASEV